MVAKLGDDRGEGETHYDKGETQDDFINYDFIRDMFVGVVGVALFGKNRSFLSPVRQTLRVPGTQFHVELPTTLVLVAAIMSNAGLHVISALTYGLQVCISRMRVSSSRTLMNVVKIVPLAGSCMGK